MRGMQQTHVAFLLGSVRLYKGARMIEHGYKIQTRCSATATRWQCPVRISFGVPATEVDLAQAPPLSPRELKAP